MSNIDAGHGASPERITLANVALHTQHEERMMDREHAKELADKAKGAIKEGTGKVTGDKELESEGKLDKAKGSAHEVAGT